MSYLKNRIEDLARRVRQVAPEPDYSWCGWDWVWVDSGSDRAVTLAEAGKYNGCDMPTFRTEDDADAWIAREFKSLPPERRPVTLLINRAGGKA